MFYVVDFLNAFKNLCEVFVKPLFFECCKKMVDVSYIVNICGKTISLNNVDKVNSNKIVDILQNIWSEWFPYLNNQRFIIMAIFYEIFIKKTIKMHPIPAKSILNRQAIKSFMVHWELYLTFWSDPFWQNKSHLMFITSRVQS